MNSVAADVVGGESDSRSVGTSILFVCTGNICRSPVAELVLRSLAIPGVRIESAGTEALVGAEVDTTMRGLLFEDGIDASGLRARQLTPRQAETSDIILTASSEHRRTVLRDVPSALRRTFTVRELADLVECAERDGPLEEADRKSRLAQLVRLRGDRPTDCGDDIEDPYGLSDVHYARAYSALSTSIRGPIARLLASFTHD